MKIENRKLSALAILVFSYILIGIYVFANFNSSSFFLLPVLNYQQVLEPFVYLIILAVGNILFLKLYFGNLREKVFSKLGLELTLCFFLIGVGFGIHSTAQIIENTLLNTTDNLYHFVYFLDEYPGHYFLTAPLLIIEYLLLTIDSEEEHSSLNILQKIVLYSLSILYGIFWVILGFEGGSQYIVMTPIMIFSLITIFRRNKDYKFLNPYTKFFVVSSMVFLFGVAFFGLTNGFFIQPISHLGWQIRF